MLWKVFDSLAAVTSVVVSAWPKSPVKHLVSNNTCSQLQELADMSRKPNDIEHYSDDEVLGLHREPCGDAEEHFRCMWRVSKNALIKVYPDDVSRYPREAAALRLVATQTDIPVPQVFRVIPDPGVDPNDDLVFIFLEYVPGEDLSRVWPRLSWRKKLMVALTLRSYVKQLCRINHPRETVLGPLGPDS